MFIIIDKTNNTGKDILAEGNELTQNYCDGLQFETKQEAQKYIDEQELNVLKNYQMQWATIIEIPND